MNGVYGLKEHALNRVAVTEKQRALRGAAAAVLVGCCCSGEKAYRGIVDEDVCLYMTVDRIERGMAVDTMAEGIRCVIRILARGAF